MMYWWMAFTAFIVSMIAVVVERTNAKVAAEADKTKCAPLGEPS